MSITLLFTQYTKGNLTTIFTSTVILVVGFYNLYVTIQHTILGSNRPKVNKIGSI